MIGDKVRFEKRRWGGSFSLVEGKRFSTTRSGALALLDLAVGDFINERSTRSSRSTRSTRSSMRERKGRAYFVRTNYRAAVPRLTPARRVHRCNTCLGWTSFLIPGEVKEPFGSLALPNGVRGSLTPSSSVRIFYFAILESFAAWTKAEQKASTFLSTTN